METTLPYLNHYHGDVNVRDDSSHIAKEMEWTPQILHDRIKQSAAVQAQQPTAWDWIDKFKQEKNAILLVFDVLRNCSDLDMFRLTVMLLKKIINSLISMLQNQDILAFIELLMTITTKVVITDKPTLNNLCYILAKLAVRSDSNMVIALFSHFKKASSSAENPEFTQYYTIYLLNFLYESLTILDEKHSDAENLLNQFRSISQELLAYLEDNRNRSFSSVVICFKLGIKLDLFHLSNENLYANKLFLMMFEALLNPSIISSTELAGLPVNIEMVLNVIYYLCLKLKRRGNICNYPFYDSFYANFLNVLQNGTQSAYSAYEDDDEFLLNLYYMAYSVVNIHDQEISQILLQRVNSFESIPIIEMTLYCIHKIEVTKIVSCLSIWRDLLYLCRLKVTSQKVEEWGALHPNLLVSHYYFYYLKNIMSVVYKLANDSDNLGKGFYRLHQCILAFFDRPPLCDQVISSYMIESHIKPNIITIPINNNPNPVTILNTKGFVGVAFMKSTCRLEFLPLMKLMIDNQLYLLNEIYLNDPFLHMALIDLVGQFIELSLEQKYESKHSIASIESFKVSTNNAMTYFLYLYGFRAKFSRSLYKKLIRCMNRLFTLDSTNFQVYVPDFLTVFVLNRNCTTSDSNFQTKIINDAYTNTNKKVTDTAVDILDHCVHFTCSNLSSKCDTNHILSSLFTPHVDIIATDIGRGKINKTALHFFKVALEALDVSKAKPFYIQVVDKMLPIFLTILTGNVHEHEIIENTCSCLRRIVRDLGTFFAPYLDALISSVKSAFEANFHPTYLYISSVVVDEFGHLANSDPNVANSINNLVDTMFNLSLPHICRFDNGPISDSQMQDHIDQSIEDFFVLTKRLLRLYPTPFFNHSKIGMICDVAITFLSRKDSYTVSSVVAFWSVLMDIAIKSSCVEQKDAASKILVLYMPKIVYTIMGEMIQHPIYSILDAYCDLLYDIKKCDPNLYVQSLNLTINQIRTNDHIPAHIAIVEEISKESLSLNSRDSLVDICERTLVKHA